MGVSPNNDNPMSEPSIWRMQPLIILPDLGKAGLGLAIIQLNLLELTWIHRRHHTTGEETVVLVTGADSLDKLNLSTCPKLAYKPVECSHTINTNLFG